MSDEKPWEDYPDPVAQKVPVVTDPGVGYGEDIGKGFVGGVARGTTGLVGGAGSFGNLVHAGLSYAGVPEDYINKGAAVVRRLPYVSPFAGPSGADVQKAVEGYTGPFYEPKTVPGQYASTIGEFAPAALAGPEGIVPKVFNTLVPAVVSETAGQLTKGTAAEPWARGITALAAGPLAAKMVTPAAPASPAYRAAVDVLKGENIPLTAGQRTGSKPLQWMEANAADMPFSADRAQELKAKGASGFDRAVTSHLFDAAELKARGVPADVTLPDPRVVVAGKQSLSDKYTQLAQANQLRSDPQLQRDLLAAQTTFEQKALPEQLTKGVEKIRNNIVDALVQGQGSMPGDVYQAKRSQLGTLAKSASASNPYLGTALKDMQTALDDAMARGLSPADAQAWALNNQRYANMKQITPAIARAGENLSPQAVAQTARTGRAAQFAAQAGDLDPLSKAASLVMKPLPNSGTAARSGWQHLFNIPMLAAAGGGAAAGSPLGPLGIAAGAAAPFAASRLALTRPGQAYLGNQLMPQNMRDIITQTLAQQAISQPSQIARNQAAQAAYEQKRKDDLRKMGLQ